jgi:hypothetical protein
MEIHTAWVYRLYVMCSYVQMLFDLQYNSINLMAYTLKVQ